MRGSIYVLIIPKYLYFGIYKSNKYPSKERILEIMKDDYNISREDTLREVILFIESVDNLDLYLREVNPIELDQ